ncbi:FadR/GntR family transcriptional regulator [Streptomyces sp. NPDC101062]|uniref:FadR/GntR family transcriptional regulator n=1 Tax=unclassified Streptomyces TaxID=2593676 RepID=UPI002E7A4944|nr:GntR family transcriptional regulator [Streptomyces sp. JV176]MEE1801130.1 GntR family transcriptional regulator [Streptomyces sp. JV176]
MTTPRTPARELFKELARTRSVDDVVAQLRHAVLSGRVPDGERLPSERELAEAFGVSRATVREAIRVLEASGIVQVRLGAHGGAFATKPGPGVMGLALSSLLTLQATTEAELAEFRFAFEQDNAELAARRITDEQRGTLAELLAAARAAKRWKETEQVDFAVHELLAVASGNSVRVAISQGIHDAVLRVFERTEPQPSSVRILRDDTIAVASAVLDGDPAAARRAMREHMSRWVDDPSAQPRRPSQP